MGSYVGKISYCELQNLEVINVVDGSILGTISDLEIDSSSGHICTITVKTLGKLLKILNPDRGIIIPWNQIIKIGDDVIIVNYNCLLN